MVQIGNDWDELLKGEFQKEYYQNLRKTLVNEYRIHTVYPDMHDIFNSLKYTPYEAVKVVIIGQDPYHGRGQAHGLSFSVKKGIAVPRSLQNIYKELQADLGCDIPDHGELIQWARQGVLMMNAVLTVRASEPNSHKGLGWEQFTDHVIELLNEREKPIVFLLWGANAGAKAELITNPNHLILRAPHPSPFSADRGFFGCRHFSKANEFLICTGQTPVDWQIR